MRASRIRSAVAGAKTYRHNAFKVELAQRAADIDWQRFEGIKSLGITAGASAPEVIVEEIMGAFAERFQLHVETVSAAEENEFFPLPRSVRPDAA